MAQDLNQSKTGIFVPTTSVWDVQQIQSIDVNSEEFKELLVRLYQNINNIVLALNIKTSGYYDINEFVTGNLYFPGTFNPGQYRQTQRKVINFGTLPDTAEKSVAHGINVTANTTWVQIYGTTTDPVGLTGAPIPFASETANETIAIFVDATNVNIFTGIDRTNFTTTYVVLEYLQT